MRRLIDHFALFNQMSAINRFSRDRMAKQENVLEHTGFVVLFCLFVAKSLNKNAECDYPFNIGMLLEKAALHDLDETVLGDIPRPTKYMSQTTALEFKAAEERAVERIGQFFKIGVLVPWLYAKDPSQEGRLVAIADLAAVVYALWTEVALYGNHSFSRVGRELRIVLDTIRKQDSGWTWEKDIVEELISIVNDCRYEDKGHPQLQSLLQLDDMLKEEEHAKEDAAEDEEIPF